MLTPEERGVFIDPKVARRVPKALREDLVGLMHDGSEWYYEGKLHECDYGYPDTLPDMIRTLRFRRDKTSEYIENCERHRKLFPHCAD